MSTSPEIHREARRIVLRFIRDEVVYPIAVCAALYSAFMVLIRLYDLYPLVVLSIAAIVIMIVLFLIGWANALVRAEIEYKRRHSDELRKRAGR